MTCLGGAGMSRSLCLLAACVALAAFLLACGRDGTDQAATERMLLLEAKVHSLEESLEFAQQQNAALRSELDALGQNGADDSGSLDSDSGGLEERLGALEETQAQVVERLGALEGQGRDTPTLQPATDALEARVDALETTAEGVKGIAALAEKAFSDLDTRLSLLEGDVAEKTARVARSAGVQAQVINFGAAYGAERPAVLALPDPMPEGEIPLIVSLHGFGGDSFSQSLYVPLHRWVNERGFALLLPNGAVNDDGQQFWNPTDLSFDGKGPQVDDFAALSALVDEGGGEFDRGPVYFFGYSNGGFMSYWMACQGLPGLRAVASLAGTSYMDDNACAGAAPVSVLHIHGTDDAVVRFDGVQGQPDALGKDGPGYADAPDMARRWAARAGCDGPEPAEPYALLDLDDYVPGAETQAYSYKSGCEEGIRIELWASEGSGHSPGYGDAFVNALLDWLLAQE